MRATIETLEHRQLMSVRPEGGVTNAAVLETAPVLHRGTLLIDGTSGDDNITVTVEKTKKGKSVLLVRLVSGDTVDGTLNGSVTRSVYVPWDTVSLVVVNGHGGDDQLVTDVTAYKVTKSIDVDTRAVTGVNRRGRTIFSEDPMSSAMLGELGGSTEAWADRAYADVMRVKRSLYQSPDVLFLGNSHINYLTQTGAEVFKQQLGTVPSVNLGLPGDTTSQLLYRMYNQNLVRFGSPKVIVVEAGTNNVALSDDVDAIARGVEKVVLAIHERQPRAKVLLNSILPRRTNAENKVVNKVNDRLAAFCDSNAEQRNGLSLAFLNMTPDFAGDRALVRYYKPNNVHLNSRGYRVWVDRLAPLIDRLVDNS